MNVHHTHPSLQAKTCFFSIFLKFTIINKWITTKAPTFIAQNRREHTWMHILRAKIVKNEPTTQGRQLGVELKFAMERVLKIYH